MKNPFSLNNEKDYQHWRKNKLSAYPLDINKLIVKIDDPSNINPDEVSTLISIVGQHNLAFYRFTNADNRDKKTVHALGKQLGLINLDGNVCADSDKLTSIEVRKNENQHDYIPYTQRKLSWHTDGYYNSKNKQIMGFSLHCAQPAMKGGTNMIMDTDIAYILLRDENPEYIKALMQADAMTIPANILNGEIIRDEQAGPVFSVTENGYLHMRYSARKRNIIWKEDEHTCAAVAFLENLWETGSPYILEYKLKSGVGMVCNNVLHNRTEFEDSLIETEKRLLYRGRYYDRIHDRIYDRKTAKGNS